MNDDELDFDQTDSSVFPSREGIYALAEGEAGDIRMSYWALCYREPERSEGDAISLIPSDPSDKKKSDR